MHRSKAGLWFPLAEAVTGPTENLRLSDTGKNWDCFISQASFRSIGTYFFPRREVQPLSQQETEELILDSLQGTGVVFRPFVSQQIWKCTLGHPFLIQVLCYNLFDSQVNGIVDQNAWDKSYRKSIDQVGDTMYQSLLQAVTEQEAKLLRCFMHDINSERNEICCYAVL